MYVSQIDLDVIHYLASARTQWAMLMDRPTYAPTFARSVQLFPPTVFHPLIFTSFANGADSGSGPRAFRSSILGGGSDVTVEGFPSDRAIEASWRRPSVRSLPDPDSASEGEAVWSKVTSSELREEYEEREEVVDSWTSTGLLFMLLRSWSANGMGLTSGPRELLSSSTRFCLRTEIQPISLVEWKIPDL